MIALLLQSPITLASAEASSAQSIVFVNNSINVPAFDSFIQIDSFSTAPPKILDSKVHLTRSTPHALCAPCIIIIILIKVLAPSCQ
jgi:hypothetical protein